MGSTRGMDPDAVEAIFDWVQARHPAAPLTAIGGDGLSLPLPADFDPGDHVVLKGRSALDFVEPADHVAVVAAWERTRAEGAARVFVRLVSGRTAYLHFVDMRRRYGAHFAVFVAAEDGEETPADDVLAGHDDLSDVPPRVCRMHRDEVAVVTEIDDAVTALLGWPADRIVGTRSIELVHPDDVERAIANWMEMLAAPYQPHRWRGRYQKADGSWLWLDITNINRLEDPTHADVVTEMVDISDEMAVHEALRERERLLRRLTEALPTGVLQFDASRRVLHANDQAAAILGGGTVDALLAAVVDDHRPTLEAAIAAALSEGLDSDLELHLDGDRVCRVALRALCDDNGAVTGALACVDDVTDGVRLRRQLELRATFDGLTACYSRSAILTALDELVHQGPTGVVFVDLDRFKPVNDAYGHAAGDELLVAVGERLRSAVRDVDIVGRLGGDEFLVACPGVSGPKALAAVAGRIAAAVAEPVQLAGDLVVVPHASIGTAWAEAGTDPSALVAQADAAMYAAKHGAADRSGAATG